MDAMDAAVTGSGGSPALHDAAGEGGSLAPLAPYPAAVPRGAPAPDAAAAADLASTAAARAAGAGADCRPGELQEPARTARQMALEHRGLEALDAREWSQGRAALVRDREQGARDASQPQMTINFRVPGYIAYLDDGSRVEFENIDHIVELNETDGYTMSSLVADLARKTKWGTCQDPVFWYWDFEKKGLQIVVSNEDLRMVFQKFQIWGKRFSFVVEFPLKPAYKSSMSIEAKMEKLPVRRNPHLPRESKRGRHTPRGNHKGPR
ncbi:hypothetical protein EJB05_06175, partial [Eragrostis curvula]